MCLVLTANPIRLSLAFHVLTTTSSRHRAEYDAGKMPGFAASKIMTWRLFLTGTNVPSTIPTCGQETVSSSLQSLTTASAAVTIWLGIAGSSSNGNSHAGSACNVCECSHLLRLAAIRRRLSRQLPVPTGATLVARSLFLNSE